MSAREDRRTYAREYARKRRAAKLRAQQMGTRRCPAGAGRGVCGGLLDTVVDRMTGRTWVVCPLCERKRRGICRDCPRAVAGTVGKSLRCAECTAAAKKAAFKRYARDHRAEINRRAKKAYRTSEAVRERRNAYKRLWRQANPDKVRKQKRREALKQSPRVRAYMAAYRETHREHYRVMMREHYHGTRTARRCPTPGCTAALAGKAKKCAACKAADRARAAAALAARTRPSAQERAA